MTALGRCPSVSDAYREVVAKAPRPASSDDVRIYELSCALASMARDCRSKGRKAMADMLSDVLDEHGHRW